MTKLIDWVAATAIGAAIVTATPAVAFHGGGTHIGGCRFGGTGGMRLGRQGSARGFHNPACFRDHRPVRNVVFVGRPFFYDYVPSYYDYVPYYYVPYYYDYVLYGGNYCWHQIWTPSGWQWVDACPGYHGYAY
jgi:hypothetical protein